MGQSRPHFVHFLVYQTILQSKTLVDSSWIWTQIIRLNRWQAHYRYDGYGPKNEMFTICNRYIVVDVFPLENNSSSKCFEFRHRDRCYITESLLTSRCWRWSLQCQRKFKQVLRGSKKYIGTAVDKCQIYRLFLKVDSYIPRLTELWVFHKDFVSIFCKFWST